ncbi:DUF1508 domain-containing protein [Natronomonas salina]|uniref:HVO_2922 family protein n=1 Tax=Natronomonas salina TaxID=1710540 RepID=UPI0015B39666|nr:HVO_2922 family protein [Natronomonas salina]QLD88146.1 DUF1508 domain-containing protein [Natronomonas salina]
MDDETVFEFEGSGSRAEIAASLRAITAQLSGSGPISLTAGDETVSVQPAESIDFEVEVEREGEDGERQIELEIELEWPEKADGETGSAGGAVSSDGESETTEPVGEADEAESEADVVDLEADHTPAEPEEGVAEAVGSLGTFEVFEDRAGEWRWRLVHRNGNVIATSGEGYTRRRNAEKGLRSVVENAPGADVVDDL